MLVTLSVWCRAVYHLPTRLRMDTRRQERVHVGTCKHIWRCPVHAKCMQISDIKSYMRTTVYTMKQLLQWVAIYCFSKPMIQSCWWMQIIHGNQPAPQLLWRPPPTHHPFLTHFYMIRAGFLIFVLVFVSCHLELGWVPADSPSRKSFSDFNEIRYVDRTRWVMHDGMPYDSIQGQGHECLKATREQSTVSPAWD